MLNNRFLLSSLVLAAAIPRALTSQLYGGSTPSTEAVCPWWNDHCTADCNAMGSDPNQDAISVTCLATPKSGDTTTGNLVPDQGLRLQCDCWSYSYVKTTVTSNILLEMSPLINKAEGINAAYSNSSKTDAICGPWGNVCGRTCNIAQPGTVASSKCIETYDGHIELDCSCGDTEYGNEAMKRLGADLNGGSYTPKASASASQNATSSTSMSSSSSTSSSSTSTSKTTSSSAAGAISTGLTTDGQCGKANGKTCTSEYGSCCSVYGWCGSSSDHCAASNGCQSGFGHCDSAVNGTSSGTTKAAGTTTAAATTAAGSTTSSSSSASSSSSGSSSTGATQDGKCGASNGRSCTWAFGQCCSQYGYCGWSDDHCNASKGCQSKYGKCNGLTPVSSSAAAGSTPTSGTIVAKVSKDGTCGRGYSRYTCTGSAFGNCCSQYGWCGNGASYCGTGCNRLYGSCP